VAIGPTAARAALRRSWLADVAVLNPFWPGGRDQLVRGWV